MSRIKILPEILSNKIAAGEVVERPASVVKELVENALDAGGSRIIVEVAGGGKSLIRVSDDGIGMSHDDALLALERYATSKIYKDRDLFDIRTLGFRGEALPSIAAVSRLSLVTREKQADSGTEIVVDGGKIRQVSETGTPAGTMISVKQLFFNTPARRKFLKTVNTEMGHVADTLSSIAMGWPDVRFRLLHNERLVKDWPAASDPADRAADVIGGNVRSHLIPILLDHPALAVSGWLAAAGEVRSTTRGIYICVNGRYVKDRIIRHALLEGYAGRLMKGRFPVAALFLRVPFDRVDVNVHPTKHEVRFADARTIHDAIAGVVAETLLQTDPWRPKSPERERTGHDRGEEMACPGIGERNRAPGDRQWIAATDDPPEGRDHRPGTAAVAEKPSGFRGEAPSRPVEPKTAGTASAGSAPDRTQAVSGVQRPIWQKRRLAQARIIGQFHGTYIVCETDDGLMLVDQHAAHERITYEQLKSRAAAEPARVQKLLMPETIDLGYREADALDRLLDAFGTLGFEIEPFGGNTFVVRAVPAILSGRQIAPMIVESVEKAVTIGFGAGLEKALDECLMLMACHGAIRANQDLSEMEIRRLLADLDRCDNPSHCPHGRPTWIRWSLRELEKTFRRIA